MNIILQREALVLDYLKRVLEAPNEKFTYRGTPIGRYPTAAELALAEEHAKPHGAATLVAEDNTKLKTQHLPSLELVPGSVAFVDPKHRNAIEAGGKYQIKFAVKNVGKGDARNCKPRIKAGADLDFASLEAFTVPAGGTKEITAVFMAKPDMTSGKKSISVAVDEPNGFGTDAHVLELNAYAFAAPMVVVNDYTVSSSTGAPTLQRKVPFDLQLLLQNIEGGAADNVQVAIEVPANVFIVEGKQEQTFPQLNAGETKLITYTLVANNAYTASSIPVKVRLKERYGKYAKDRALDIAMDQPLAAGKTSVTENATKPVDIQIASLTSEVDRNIPRTNASAPNTFAVVIANENYTQVDPVDFAVNDGQMFARYCTDVLGLPESNVHVLANATRNQMLRQLNWLGEIGQAYGNDAAVIFYYSGHGVPSEEDKTAYLLPVDGDHADMSTNLALDDVYKSLSQTGVSQTVVLLDACFSGSKRGDSMLKAARGVKIKPKKNKPLGNMVVLSAAQGDETAYPLNSERHGLFTYYLLKKLKDTSGKVNLGEIADFVTTEVSRRSVVENSKPQTPSAQASEQMLDVWRTINLTK